VFFAQALPLVTLPLVLGLAALIALKPWEPPVAAKAGIAVAPEILEKAARQLKARGN